MTTIIPDTAQQSMPLSLAALRPTNKSERLDYDQFMALPEGERHRTDPQLLPHEIIEPLDQLLRKNIQHGVRPNSTRKGFVPLSPDLAFQVEWEGANTETPPRQYLVKKLLPRTGVALLSGTSGAGKSFLSIDLAGSLATGTPFFGQKVIKGGTLILASEAYDTQNDRLKAYREGKLGSDALLAAFGDLLPSYPPQFPIAVAPIDIISGNNIEKIISTCKHYDDEMLEKFAVPLRLVVIDTFAAAFGLQDENSSAEVTAAMKLLQRLAAELDVLVAVVVHHGKMELSGVRGSSAFEASADVRLTVQYSKDLDGKVFSRTVSLGKSRYDETGWCHTFKLEPHVLGVDEDGEDITSCYVVDWGEPKEKPSKVKRNRKARHRKNLLTALDKAVADEGETPTDDGWVPTNTVRVHFADIGGTDDPKSEAFRKLCERTEREAEYDGEIEFKGSRSEKKMRRAKIEL
jgi:hypothetical protein